MNDISTPELKKYKSSTDIMQTVRRVSQFPSSRKIVTTTQKNKPSSGVVKSCTNIKLIASTPNTSRQQSIKLILEYYRGQANPSPSIYGAKKVYLDDLMVKKSQVQQIETKNFANKFFSQKASLFSPSSARISLQGSPKKSKNNFSIQLGSVQNDSPTSNFNHRHNDRKSSQQIIMSSRQIHDSDSNIAKIQPNKGYQENEDIIDDVIKNVDKIKLIFRCLKSHCSITEEQSTNQLDMEVTKYDMKFIDKQITSLDTISNQCIKKESSDIIFCSQMSKIKDMIQTEKNQKEQTKKQMKSIIENQKFLIAQLTAKSHILTNNGQAQILSRNTK